MIAAFRGKVVTKKIRSPRRPKVPRNTHKWEERRMWRTMFEDHRKSTVAKLLNNEAPTNITEIPPGSKCFWENIFSDKKCFLVKLAVEIDGRPVTTSNLWTSYRVRSNRPMEKDSQAVSRGTRRHDEGNDKEKDIKELTEIMKSIFEDSIMPSTLKRFKMHFLQKVPGSMNPKDYRPLNIGNVTKRIASGILVARAKDILEPKTRQRGFQMGMEGCVENTLIIQMYQTENQREERHLICLYWPEEGFWFCQAPQINGNTRQERDTTKGMWL